MRHDELTGEKHESPDVMKDSLLPKGAMAKWIGVKRVKLCKAKIEVCNRGLVARLLNRSGTGAAWFVPLIDYVECHPDSRLLVYLIECILHIL